MIKSIKTILAQDKEKFKVPNKVQDLIPSCSPRTAPTII